MISSPRLILETEPMLDALRRLVAVMLVLSTTLATFPAHAGMIAAGSDRARIAAMLEREDVREQLAARGVSLEQARARVEALTDTEAAELAGAVDALPAGGVDILGVALVVFLVLLLTDILGYTKIFPFTKPARN
jgi:hypothetical protein